MDFYHLFNGAIRDRRKSHTGCAMIAVYQILVYCVFLCQQGGTSYGSTGEGRVLRAAISGEVDHHRARAIMEELSRQIDLELPRSLTLDLEGVTFMDSSGIGLVMGRYRQMKFYDGELQVTGTSPQIYKVMRIAGLDRLCLIERSSVKK